MDLRPKQRLETIKFLQENIGRTLNDITQSKILHDLPPTVMEIKAKINKRDLTKLKSFCTAKETTNKVKRQPSGLKKILAKETVDKENNFQNMQAAHTIPEKETAQSKSVKKT